MVKQSTMIIERELDSSSDYSLQVNRWYLKSIGAWPSSSFAPTFERVVSVVLIIICYCSMLFTAIPCMLHIFLEDEDIHKKLRATGPLINMFMGSIKYSILLFRGNEICDCVEHIQIDWQIISRVQHRLVMTRYAKFGRYVSVFCAVFTQLGVASYCFVNALSTRSVQIGNETRIVHVLPLEFYKKLLNIDESPTYEIVFVSQFISTSIVNFSSVGAFSLAVALAAHACGQLNILMSRIIETVNGERDRDAKILLNETGVVVENHLRILSFISQIEEVMNKICFIEMFHTSLCTCMLGYYILTEWDDRDYQNLSCYFMILFSMTFNVFLLCYIGQTLTEQVTETSRCNRLRLRSRFTEYILNSARKCILDLRMIIVRSSVMIKITASKMFHMSVYTFGQILYDGLLPRRVQSTTRTWMVTMRGRSSNQVKSYNNDYENDLNYTLGMCRMLLKPLGVWTFIYHRVSRLERVLSIPLMLICFSSLFFIILPSVYNMLFMEEDLQNIVKLLGPISFCMFSTIKYCLLGMKGNILGQCILHLERDWKMVQDPDHRAIMLKQASTSRFMITICVGFLYSGGMSYHTVMQFLSKERTNTNVTLRPITYPCFNFLDTQSSPTYELVFFTHCVTAMVMQTITTAGYSLAATFVTHMCGQIQIQISRLDNLIGEYRERNTFQERIAVIVRDHAEVLRFSKDVEEGLREVCLTEIVESTLIMCLLEYYCLMEWANNDTVAILTYIMLLVSFTFIIFIFCYIGELLSEQCSRMGPAAYEIHWYNLSSKNSYDLILLCAVALYPPKLSAGKIMNLSINTFGTVVKTSVIYLNLLRTFATW
ncbi:uncharacterized protein LOC143207236 [Lasioglossum baleicum]|uniref:uncharacterized protein LOC143207236 n=1 Tax=Lasioglossum baleicum TaxID=434251 RepID=UPI003FCDB9E9